jgi:hypothetical protein
MLVDYGIQLHKILSFDTSCTHTHTHARARARTHRKTLAVVPNVMRTENFEDNYHKPVRILILLTHS